MDFAFDCSFADNTARNLKRLLLHHALKMLLSMDTALAKPLSKKQQIDMSFFANPFIKKCLEFDLGQYHVIHKG
ncbi:hypothetical protein HYN46_10830 [Aquirhabdus parva]|uniref:Uncharacterized protein n=1 Tax=Aquirhabdus parva TaxID=2283318 RepID=A0A345P7N1_9GAMM|nr:hypothetical protein HYN46_10830 [Aquirhabdus parva]